MKKIILNATSTIPEQIVACYQYKNTIYPEGICIVEPEY